MPVIRHGWKKRKSLMLIKELVRLGAARTMIWQRVLPQKDNFRPAVEQLTRKSGGNGGNRPSTAGNLCAIGAYLAAKTVMKTCVFFHVAIQETHTVVFHAQKKLCQLMTEL